MQFSKKGLSSLVMMVSVLSACGGDGSSSGGGIGTGGTPIVESSSPSSINFSSSSSFFSSSSAAAVVKTSARDTFFDRYGFYPGMYKLHLAAVGDLEERTIDARIVMNEVWVKEYGSWSFNPVIDWCGDPSISGFVSENVLQDDLPRGQFFIGNPVFVDDDKYHYLYFSANVVDPKIITGSRYSRHAETIQAITLTWDSSELNYSNGMADFTTSHKKLSKVESISICHSTRKIKDPDSGKVLWMVHHGYILPMRNPEDGGIAVSTLGAHLAEFKVSANFEAAALGYKEHAIWIKLWGLTSGEWKEADSKGGDVDTVDGLDFTFDVADPEDDISVAGSMLLLDKSGE
ncbi:MAG: hypothetical protein AAGC78_02345 [Cellvibrio sp.]|uniref:hypothetical protein n=1 Tax=Cellvibrio sp. TaxID=1965322 RepID=UPI0031A63495